MEAGGSARGLFAATKDAANVSRSLKNRLRKEHEAKAWARGASEGVVNRFAGLLAEGHEIWLIAGAMRIGQMLAEALFTRICRELGPQAR